MPNEIDEYWLEILEHNKGFANPGEWISYAKAHHFKKVKSTKLIKCPNCGTGENYRVGQQIYYSTLMSMLRCGSCGLIYVDTHVDPHVIRQHFERAYKEEEYFLQQRKNIFEHIVDIVDKHSPKGARVLDIGGAKGHLLNKLLKTRPDLRPTLNDVSENACRYAAEHFGLRTICAGLTDIPVVGERYDVLLLIDVIYYEPNITRLWNAIASLVDTNSLLILRVPNKYLPILIMERLRQLLTDADSHRLRASIMFYNPEHIYLFTKRYLRTQLKKKLGFSSVTFIPSPSLAAMEGKKYLRQVHYCAARIIDRISFGAVTTTPSMLVVAQR